MKKGFKFFVLSSSLFVIMGLITLLEIFEFDSFSIFFNFIKTPASWFVGLSLAYAISNLIQNRIFSLFSKRKLRKGIENESNVETFEIFLTTLVITSLITPYIKQLAVYFFTNFFIYFQVILLQSMIILYLFFKIKNNYEVSGKYFITSEIIALIYAAIILYSIV
jgi:hypothetical protein